MIQPPHIDAARRKALCLVLQIGAQLGGGSYHSVS